MDWFSIFFLDISFVISPLRPPLHATNNYGTPGEKMICDGDTCPGKYVDEKIYEYDVYDIDEDEFIKDLRHKKCKIIQLVRRQIQNLHDAQYNLPTQTDEWQSVYAHPEQLHLTGDTIEASLPLRRDLHPRNTMYTGQEWCVHALRRIRKRIYIVVAVTGVIALLASLYGIYFRAYLCTTGGKSCLTSVRYTHAKHALF
ncbi:uncharacterized protein LOC108630986 [Ceratina calcarata]|uniref:Uncharacterized protein LOC108630986 n=1 Tax=Ceratina calcarata TaxID=156304 RepID=A0AAJ7NDN9_9HYME|nr:uncharacterized protein LOC108630986 [Ceratina calcarata]